MDIETYVGNLTPTTIQALVFFLVGAVLTAVVNGVKNLIQNARAEVALSPAGQALFELIRHPAASWQCSGGQITYEAGAIRLAVGHSPRFGYWVQVSKKKTCEDGSQFWSKHEDIPGLTKREVARLGWEALQLCKKNQKSKNDELTRDVCTVAAKGVGRG